jgi:ferric-dicitrate binding protein FerR (iron transport regulator)
MSCEEYRNLVEKYLDGIITDSEFAELKTHTETCPSCLDEFNRCVLVQDVVKDALSSHTPANEAAASLVAGLSAKTHQRPGSFFAGRRAAIAASILLAAVLLAGFALGRLSGLGQTLTPVTAQVPIHAAEIRGTVLVRHEGSELWHTLDTGSRIYLGDTFYAAADSACILELDDESTLDLKQNSMLILRLYNGATQFHLEHGQLTAALESPHPPFFISTPHGRVEALGTEFTVTVE